MHIDQLISRKCKELFMLGENVQVQKMLKLMNKLLILCFTAVIDGIPDPSLAVIGNTSNEVILTVVASDDPYGKFAFTTETKSLTIAEDFYPGQESTTKATFTVERRQGIFGNVEVKQFHQVHHLIGNFDNYFKNTI